MVENTVYTVDNPMISVQLTDPGSEFVMVVNFSAGTDTETQSLIVPTNAQQLSDVSLDPMIAQTITISGTSMSGDYIGEVTLSIPCDHFSITITTGRGTAVFV